MNADRPPFEERFDVLAVLAHRVAFRLLGDRGEAEDVAQEALARAFVRWRRIHRYDEAWVTRVSVNLAIGVLRRRRPTAELGDHGGPDHAGGVAERSALVAALEALPRRQREVVVLRYLADLPEAEVARQLGCTAGTVKQHAHRGLTALRSTLGTDLHPPAVPDPDETRGGDDVRALR